MGKPQKQWANLAKRALRFLLFNKCYFCGNRHHLEFDCIIPQGDKHHRMESSGRMSFYRKQFRKNNLRLLCEKCHRQITCEQNNQETFFF